MSNEREAFEYEAGKALSLPVSIIEQARKGERYDHDFDSMSLMQPINGWWHWWQAGREGMESKLTKAEQKVEDLQSQLTALTSQLESVVAENSALKSNLMYWSSEDAEPARSPLDIAHEASFGEGVEFDVQVAARMPSMTYRVVRRTTYSTEIELVRGGVPETPATDAFLAEVRAQGVEIFADSLLCPDLDDTIREFADELRKGVQS